MEKLRHIYVHVPFCAEKCGYCVFYSLASPAPALVESCMSKLETDFASFAEACGELESIYIGGGTPTYLSETVLRRLFGMISSIFTLSSRPEISVEVNPSTMTMEKARIIADFANRASVGVQSFRKNNLEMLQRKSDSLTALKSIGYLREAGLRNIGIDLIYGIPGQSIADWREDLQIAGDLGIEHISAYALTVEEGCLLSVDGTVPDDDLAADMWQLSAEILSEHGFKRYEISNFARPGFECRHNLNTWHGGAYLGFGPSAASYDGKIRFRQPSSVTAWLSDAPAEEDEISPEDRAAEIFVTGLRRCDGWTRKDFRNITGLDYTRWQEEISSARKLGFLKVTKNSLRCTEKGLLFWDSLACMF